MNPLQEHNLMYGNWVMQGPDGTIMCRCDSKRAAWYLKRGLADKIDSMTFRLRFTPNGPGHHGKPGAEYYLGEKNNNCVVCNHGQITRHHVVPYWYRQHFPLEYKSRRSHDVVPLCVKHHLGYDDAQLALEKEISREFGVPLEAPKNPHTQQALKMSNIANTILTKGDALPPTRREELVQMVSKYLGVAPKEEDLVNLAGQWKAIKKWRPPIEETHGYRVAQILIRKNMIEDFILRWRQHFVDSMHPAFLADGWTVDLILTPEEMA